jgi:RNA polymerase sigma factor (sigma-70 family)
MSDASLSTTQLHAWTARIRAGDPTARDELLRATIARLDVLARKMLRQYPGVARWEDTADVVQEASLRLLRSLAEVDPADTRGYFNLAATQIRRQLIDLARRYAGAHGLGANHDSVGPDGLLVAGASADPDLERWTAFHEAVERLPVEEREVFGLTFYHNWTQAEIAGLFGVDERTVRRRFRAASQALGQVLGGEWPGGE